MTRLITNKQAADLLRVTTRTLHRMRHAKKIPFYKINGRIRYHLADIEAYLERNQYNTDIIETLDNEA